MLTITLSFRGRCAYLGINQDGSLDLEDFNFERLLDLQGQSKLEYSHRNQRASIARSTASFHQPEFLVERKPTYRRPKEPGPAY